MSIDTVDELVAAWTADMRDESKDETARERWLRAQLAAERKRREGLEDELHLERLAHTAAVTRADQAERERDAEREAVGLSAEDRDSAIQRAEQAERERDSERLAREGAQQHRLEVDARLKEAAERNLGLIDRAELAEADNAALLALATERGCLDLGPTVDGGNPGSCNEQGWPDAGSCHACRATRTAHPGAAMLERMWALEGLYAAAKEFCPCDDHECEKCSRIDAALSDVLAAKVAP